MAYQTQGSYHPYNNFSQYPQSAFTPDYPTATVPFPATQQPPNTPLPRPKKVTRNTNNHIEQGPLKSAMKRSSRDANGRPRRTSASYRPYDDEKRRGRAEHEQMNGVQQVNSIHSRRGERSISRQRTNSRVNFIPDHVFVSLNRDNELSVTNILDEASFGKLAEAVLNMWPDGHDEMEGRHHKWRVVFHGSPWTASSMGRNGIAARRIIRNVFIALASLGFVYSSMTYSGRFSSPSLIFSRVPVELFQTLTFDFFVMSMSKNHRRLTLIEAPETIVRNLAIDLKEYLPHHVTSDRLAERGMLVLEIHDRALGTPAVDRNLFIAWILQYISRKGYVFNAAVPLGRSPYRLGFGTRKEVWVFKRMGQFGV